MAECAKILSQFNRGTSAMQHYVGLRPMFDVEVMNEDSKSVLGDQDSTPNPVDVNVALSERYKQITDTVRKESAIIRAVFPCPNDVMSILVQRVMEDRIPSLLEKLLVKPSLLNPPPTKQGGLLLYLRMLAVGYERTQELAKDLRSVGCGDLDVEGLTEALFLEHKDYYVEFERASMRQLYKAKMEELLAEGHLPSKGAPISSTHQNLSVSVVTEFVSWNEEAISRCKLFSPQPANLAANAKAVFACLLDQVKQRVGTYRADRMLGQMNRRRCVEGDCVDCSRNGVYDRGFVLIRWVKKDLRLLGIIESHRGDGGRFEWGGCEVLYNIRHICRCRRIRFLVHGENLSNGGLGMADSVCWKATVCVVLWGLVVFMMIVIISNVKQYTTEGLGRSREGLKEAASHRERFLLGRKVGAAAASAVAEAAAATGEIHFRSFMVALQACGSSVATIQQYFAKSISRLLLPVDGAHAATCEEMAAAMSSAESSACQGLQQCIEIVISEAERLLTAEQKATDYRSVDDSLMADHRPTIACTRVVAYLSRVLESAYTALEGLNKQSFLTELETGAHKLLLLIGLKVLLYAQLEAKLAKMCLTPYQSKEIAKSKGIWALSTPYNKRSPQNASPALEDTFAKMRLTPLSPQSGHGGNSHGMHPHS
ncbi:exocyst complex component SEC10A-like protein [Tanacetum coccineum]